MKNILVVRYETIGDTIFASAFYRELRKALPDAQIDVISDKISKPLMQFCPYIDNIIDTPGKYKKYLDYFKLLNMFRKYDTIYCLKNNKFYSKLAYLAGIPNRVGFKEKTRTNKFLNITLPYNEDKHEIDCYLDLLRLTGITVNNDKTECWLNPNNSEKIKNLLLAANNKKKVLIQAYSRYPIKDWTDEYWREVISYLSNELEIQVYYAGGEKDKLRYENINSKLSELKIKPINTSGKLSISETTSLVKNMDMVIGIDSGISHIAAAFGLPQIFIHGSTSLTRWKPRNKNCTVITKNLPCSPCALQSNGKENCKTRKCLETLSPNLVIKELNKHFKQEIKKTS